MWNFGDSGKAWSGVRRSLCTAIGPVTAGLTVGFQRQAESHVESGSCRAATGLVSISADKRLTYRGASHRRRFPITICFYETKRFLVIQVPIWHTACNCLAATEADRGGAHVAGFRERSGLVNGVTVALSAICQHRTLQIARHARRASAKGKPVERRGRKASGLRIKVQDGGAARSNS